eukprot:6735995-Heterocapsa_arctica.AAC.1
MRIGPRHGPLAHWRRASKSAKASHVACDAGEPMSALSIASSSGVHVAAKNSEASVHLVSPGSTCPCHSTAPPPHGLPSTAMVTP